MRILYIFLLFLFSVNLSNAQPSFVKDSLDNYVYRALGMWNIPGAAVCIVKDGKIIIARGYGVKEKGKSDKVDTNTLFLIGSNTKAFTGTLLALLENEGRLNLEDKVQKYLPGFTMKDQWVSKELNLTDIVTHRMGMETFQGDAMYWTSDLTTQEVVRKFGKLTPRYGFRTKYGYTNAGYAIAGEVIKSITDTLWSDYVSARIFKPLKMYRTLALSEEYFEADNTAKPHTFVNSRMEVIPFRNIDNLAPAGSIGSSVNDLGRWMKAQLDSGKLDGEQVIPFKVIQRTRQPFSIEGRSKHPYNRSHYGLYGLGWEMEDYEGWEIVSHTGAVNGFLTSVTLIPEKKLGIAVLTNTDQNHFYQALKWEIIDAYLELGYRNYNQPFFERFKNRQDRRAKELSALRDTAGMKLLSPSELKKYTGRYENEIYGYSEIVLREDCLEMSFEHHTSLRGKLEPLGEGRFLCTYNDPSYGITVIPFRGTAGEPESFTWSVDPFIEITTYEFVRK